MISLLHPSRLRPEKSYTTITKWLSRCNWENVEVIISIDDNDPKRGDYLRLHSQHNPILVKIISNPNRSAVDAVNNAAKVSKGNLLIVVSDDTDCPDNWDTLILRATAGRQDFVLKVWDGIQQRVITMPVLDRVYYEKFGYIYYPEYLHAWCDTEFSTIAYNHKKVIVNHDLVFLHNHYSVTGEQPDESYRRSDSHYEQGKKLYYQRIKNNFK